MISIIIDSPIQQDVLSILWDTKNREKDFGIIETKNEKDQLILSCVDLNSRDDLFQILTKKLTNS